jgi:hypothetical protein
MRRLALTFGLLVLLIPPANALAQAANSDDQQWLAQMQTLMKDTTPQAARQRATLAYWTLTIYKGRAERLGMDPNVVRTQGIKDVLAAAAGLPDSPGIWKELAAWNGLSGFDTLGASKVACPVADREPANAEVGEICGDLEKASGDVRGAIHVWKRAMDSSSDHDAKVRLIVKIEQTSAEPDKDLAGVSPTLRQQARLQEQQEQIQAAQQKAMAAAQQAQATSAAVVQCEQACSSQASQCHYRYGYMVVDSCESQRQGCNSTCIASNGASYPYVAPQPAYYGPAYAPGYGGVYPLTPYGY